MFSISFFLKPGLSHSQWEEATLSAFSARLLTRPKSAKPAGQTNSTTPQDTINLHGYRKLNTNTPKKLNRAKTAPSR